MNTYKLYESWINGNKTTVTEALIDCDRDTVEEFVQLLIDNNDGGVLRLVKILISYCDVKHKLQTRHAEHKVRYRVNGRFKLDSRKTARSPSFDG